IQPKMDIAGEYQNASTRTGQVRGEIVRTGTFDLKSARRDRGWRRRVRHIRQKEDRKRDEGEIRTPGHFRSAEHHGPPPCDNTCRDAVGWITRGLPERRVSRATGRRGFRATRPTARAR